MIRAKLILKKIRTKEFDTKNYRIKTKARKVNIRKRKWTGNVLKIDRNPFFLMLYV